MPYISPIDRQIVEESGPTTPGALNYYITKSCHDYLGLRGINYANINEVIGVLECAKLELYRMIAGKYEDEKRILNGPVSGLD